MVTCTVIHVQWGFMSSTKGNNLNNLEKTDPTEIERTTIIENSRLDFIESGRENKWKMQQLSHP